MLAQAKSEPTTQRVMPKKFQEPTTMFREASPAGRSYQISPQFTGLNVTSAGNFHIPATYTTASSINSLAKDTTNG